jgi:hypothetical protein
VIERRGGRVADHPRSSTVPHQTLAACKINARSGGLARVPALLDDHGNPATCVRLFKLVSFAAQSDASLLNHRNHAKGGKNERRTVMDSETNHLLLLLVDRCKRLDVIERIDRAIFAEMTGRFPELAVELSIAHQHLSPEVQPRVYAEYSAVETAIAAGTDFLPALRDLLSRDQSSHGFRQR